MRWLIAALWLTGWLALGFWVQHALSPDDGGLGFLCGVIGGGGAFLMAAYRTE